MPDRLRALVRGREIWIVVLAALVGVVGGALVLAINRAISLLHSLLFGIPEGQRLSAVAHLPIASALLVPVGGGVLLGLLAYALGRWYPRRIVDPIEANALHGGRMSFRDSALVTLQTMISSGCGASVGLEAGYTQIVCGLASRFGIDFRLRRRDLRVLVGCGAAAAIGAAFNAPLTGAFYAFELIIGAYTVATLAPVVTSSVIAVLMVQKFGHSEQTMDLTGLGSLYHGELLSLLPLSLLCAGIAIAIMRGVTLVELGFRKTRIPAAWHPVIGGIGMAGLAAVDPHVLSSGHGALSVMVASVDGTLLPLVVLIVLKAVASAISLGSGFRGGLFFASLFLGAMIGTLYALLLAVVLPTAAPDATVAAIVGMCGMAVAIVGGPLTMAFLALELTQDFPLSLAVLATAVISSVTVRELFGYSFATWRIHLRGETIRSAHDVGWIRDLSVGRLMRRDVVTARADTRINAFRRAFPLGSTQRVVVVDDSGLYAGIVLVPEAHVPDLDNVADSGTIADLLHFQDAMLTPAMNVREATALFDATESEALVVVDGRTTRNVIGLLTESHALRRYSEETDRARRDLVGELR